MRVARAGFVACVALVIAILAAACVIRGRWLFAAVPVACAGPWLLCLLPRRAGISGPCFAAVLCAGCAGMLLGLSAPLMLAASLFALAAWDLEELARRCRDVADAALARRLQKAHLLRLFAVLGVAAAMACGALFLRIRMAFPVVLAIGVVLTVSLGVLVRGLAGQEKAG